MAIVRAPDLFPLKRGPGFSTARDKYLRDNKGVDTMLLAESMGLSERFVIQYQRKLGIRPYTSARRKGTD